MLKYFGLKEILYGMKRFAVIILAAALVFGVFGFILTGKKDVSPEQEAQEAIYSSSYSYVFTAAEVGSKESIKDSNRACANSAAAMLKADFSMQYVYDKLLETYSKQEVLEHTQSTMDELNMNYLVLTDCIAVDVIGDTSIVNFYSTVKGEEFSKSVTDHFNEYLTQTIVKQVPNLRSFELLGSTTVELTDGADSDYAVSMPGGIKGAVLLAIVGFVLAVCAVLLYVLFNPSVASRKAFEEHGVTVIDELSSHKKNAGAFAADILQVKLEEAKSSDLAIISTVTGKRMAAQKDIIAEAVRSIGNGKVTVKTAAGIVGDFDEFAKVKACSSAVLIEQKGVTAHSRLDDTISLLEKYGIRIIGVVIV